MVQLRSEGRAHVPDSKAVRTVWLELCVALCSGNQPLNPHRPRQQRTLLLTQWADMGDMWGLGAGKKGRIAGVIGSNVFPLIHKWKS